MSERHETRIVFPAGHHAAGKTELCDYLVEQHGFNVIETGAMMRQLYKEREEEHEALSIVEYSKQKLAVDEHFFNRQLLIRIGEAEEEGGLVAVNGMRSYGGIERVKDARPDIAYAVVWISSPAEMLYERYLKREQTQISFEEFSRLLELDLSLGLGGIEEHADYRINNEGSIDDLRIKFDAIMRLLGRSAIDLSQ